MSVKLTIDTTGYNRAIKAWSAQITGKDLPQIMREEMGLLVKRCIELTAPPHGKGGGQAAKRQGEDAVARDIRKIWRDADNKKATVHAEATWHDPQRILGKVPRRGFKVKHAVPGSILAYIKKRQAKVGEVKAGWMAGAMRFGTKGIPAWVSRHGASDGNASDGFTGRGGFAEAVNTNKSISVLDRKHRIVAEAIRSRTRDIMSKLQRMMDRRASEWSRLSRRAAR